MDDENAWRYDLRTLRPLGIFVPGCPLCFWARATWKSASALGGQMNRLHWAVDMQVWRPLPQFADSHSLDSCQATDEEWL